MSARDERPNDAAHAASHAAVRAYRLLLRAYPAAFRDAYGREMEQLFRDQLDDHRRRGSAAPAGAGVLAFWAAVLGDVVRSAPALRLDALRRGPGGRGPHTQPEGGTVGANTNAGRTVAVLAVLGGLYEVVNTGAEARAGYAGPVPGWAIGMTLSVLVGALLLASGALLFRRGPAAVRRARGAAAACLALVAGLQLVFPFMSIFARLLGVGIPVALLLVTRRPRGTDGRDASAPAVA